MRLLHTLHSRPDVFEAVASTSPVHDLLRLARQVAPPTPADSSAAPSSAVEEQKEGEQTPKEEENKEKPALQTDKKQKMDAGETSLETRMEEELTTLRQLATEALKHPMPKK